ncbi:sulfotransferase family protein [Lacimicrobium alkaliphilum]|uniref:Sulfotransferase domain-containing protein n=1 Tax=Lacimicrobium alkaliphilum TaxID=1526571 RepID=A0A0U3AYQ8_9ALTE|nr:sulfotransferase [Lacimicrobium alkaliphilum]ALS99247.1 hypothetical protein AT746_13935 [Lacimicrobium alkaliphilum]
MVNLFILGVQKAGTSALANFLSQHPAVYVLRGKEAHAFDHPQYAAQADKQAFVRRQFQQRMQGYQNQPIVCDATPITVYKHAFLQDCVAWNPDARYILMLRDPVERAISHYQMSRGKGEEQHCMLLAFLLEPLRLWRAQKKQSWEFGSPLRTQSYLSRGCYTQQLRRLYQLVPASRVLVLEQSELKQTHRQTLLKVFEFLDIHRHPIAPQTVFATEKRYHHWSDPIARLYARLFFKLKGETPARWRQLIQHYQQAQMKAGD